MSEWDLAEIEYDEYLYDREKCCQCAGLGFNDFGIDCEFCEGKGYYDLSM